MGGFDGAGNFIRYYSWTLDAANGVPITASRFDIEHNGFATGLSNCITRDSQGKPIADIDWNAHKIKNLADPSLPQDAVTLAFLGSGSGLLTIKNTNISYPQTPAEAAALVTPVNLYIPSHDVCGIALAERYLTNTTPLTTDMGPGLQKAVTVGIQAGCDAGYISDCRIATTVNIDRAVDGPTVNFWFNVRGFGKQLYVDTAIPMFSSTIAYTTSPVTQLINFDNCHFIANSTATNCFILDGGKFLRTKFTNCSGEKIRVLNANTYIQSMYFNFCQFRNWTGTLFSNSNYTTITFTGSVGVASSGTLNSAWAQQTGAYPCNFSDGQFRTINLTNGSTACTWSGALSAGSITTGSITSTGFDIQVIGGMYEGGQHAFNVQTATGCKFYTQIEGLSGTALALPDSKGVDISLYTEANNVLDMDFRTNNTHCHGVHIHGSNINNLNAAYSVLWGTADGCVSLGNWHTGYFHSLQSDSNVQINDHAAISISNLDAATNIGYREGAAGLLSSITVRGLASAGYTYTPINSGYTLNGKKLDIWFLGTLTSTGTNAADQLYINAGFPYVAAIGSSLCGNVEVVGSATNNGVSPAFMQNASPTRVASSINVIPSNTVGNSWTVRGDISYKTV